MSLIARVTALLLASLSVARAELPFKRPDVSCELTDAATSGIVLLSSAMPESNSANAPTGIWYHFNRIGRSNFSDLKVMIAREQLIKDVPSDFDGAFGRLYAIKVEAGDYEFRQWTYTRARQSERTAAVRSPRKPVSRLPFKVTAGRVVYLGSFAPSLLPDDSLSVVIGAQSQRDLAVFARKCPNVDTGRIDVQPLQPGPWN